MKAKQITKLIFYIMIIAIMLPAVSLSSPHETEFNHPEQIVVRDLQESLLQVMRKGEQLGFQERFDFLAPIIDQTHNLNFIIRTALGTYWSKLDQDQQNMVTDIFRQLSIATYAGRFKSYGGEQFEIVEQRALPQDQVLIRSRLIKADSSIVNFDYVLQQSNEHWRIVNILVDGVSDLALKRVEYRAILQREGFPALIEMLKDKIVQAEQDQ